MRHTDVVDIINGINRSSTRAKRQRRQTTPRASIYDIPVSPEKHAEAPPQEEASSFSNSAQGLSEPTPNQQPEFEEGEEWVEGQESSDNNDEDAGSEIYETPRDGDENGPEDPFQVHVNLFSDANEASSDSRERSPSEVLEEPSVNSPEPRAVASPEPVSEVGPDDKVAVVISTRVSGHQADGEDGEGIDVGDESPPGSQSSSVPETPPAQPHRSTRSARTRVEDHIRDFSIELDDQLDEDGTKHERMNEDQSQRDALTEIATAESKQTQNEGNGALRELRNWFWKEIDESAMEKNWRVLYTQGRELRRYRSKPMPEYLQESDCLIAHLRDIYEEIISFEEFSSNTEEQLDGLRENMFTDAKEMFEYASETTRDASVLDQFEAHLIPRLVTLVLFSFRTFTILGRSAARQFTGTLDLVLRCSVRVDDYRKAGYLPAQARSRKLHLPLKRLKMALRDGRLNNHLRPAVAPQTEPQPSQLPTQYSIPPSYVPWTAIEEEALIEGLRRFTSEFYWFVPSRRRS